MTYYIFYSVFLLGLPQPFCPSPVLSFTHPLGLHCSHSLTPIIQSTESYGLSLLFVFPISLISVSSRISFLDLIYLRYLSMLSNSVHSTPFNFGSRSDLVFYCGSEAADVSNSLYFGAGQQDRFFDRSKGESLGG